MRRVPTSRERWQRIAASFERVAAARAEERPALLAALGHDDRGLRREVEEMLDADGDANALPVERRLGLHDASPAGAGVLAPGAMAGCYRIESLIGAGGMADVYRAERADVRDASPVALKVLRVGCGTADLARRFRVEREALARLRHPGVARILDAGTLDDGRPFIALELVDGEPITRFCEARSLPLRDRLALFMKVVEAVHFAHTQLVVHRDLKPSNILVQDDGTPRLLDFGIAKLLDPSPSASLAVETMPELRLLTPEYASPEQIRGESPTVATDVYALGVLLFELVTGRTPFATSRGDLHALQRAVLDRPVPPPSRLVASPAVADAVRGDLDRIVLMALRKEPERRYGTAAQLGEDVARWLAGRPVYARGDSARYRLASFASRHRAATTATIAGALILVSLGAMAAAESRRIAREHEHAERERRAVEGALALLDRLRARAPFDASAAAADASSAGFGRTTLDSSMTELRRLARDASSEERTASPEAPAAPAPAALVW